MKPLLIAAVVLSAAASWTCIPAAPPLLDVQACAVPLVPVAVYGADVLTAAELTCLQRDVEISLPGVCLFLLPTPPEPVVACPPGYAGLIVFTTEPPPPEYMGENGVWGLAWQHHGVAVVYVGAMDRRNPWLVANVAMHEYGHLCGLEHACACHEPADCWDCFDCMAAPVPAWWTVIPLPCLLPPALAYPARAGAAPGDSNA